MLETAVAIDPDRQTAARAYARARHRLLLINLIVSFLLVAGFLLSGASVWLKDLLAFAGNRWLLVTLYLAIVFIGYEIITLPLSWYGGSVLPHRFDMSTQTPRGWLTDEAKSLGLGLLFGVPIALGVYWLLDSQPTTWWIWASVAATVLGVIMNFLAPVLLLPIFYKLTPLDDHALVARVTALAEKTGLRIAGVYTINLSSRTRAANALFMGMGRTKRIALGDTLYAEFPPDEIETVIAHELGHQVHHDLPLEVVVQAVFTTCGLFVAHLFLQWGVARFGLEGSADVAALPLLVLAAAIFSLLTMPLANAISRWRERLADDFALRVTGKPTAFASAMTRLANQNLAQVAPPRWLVWLLYTHPPISERIAAAQRQEH
jgi:Zn-dependent protease with chaperone function